MTLSPKRAHALQALAGIAGLLAVYGFFYYLVSKSPYYMDDYSYAFNWAASGRNETLGHIFASLRVHYLGTNGRIPLHFFAFLFMMLPKGVFNAVCAAVFCGLGFVMYYHSFGTLRNFRWSALFLFYLGLYYCVPRFADSFLWLDGACNYLFGPVIALYCLIPWRRYYETGTMKLPAWAWTASLFLLGLIAGWTNENLSLACIAVEIGFVVLCRLERKPLHLWMAAGLLGTVAGMCLMLFAPGQLARAGNDGIQGVSLWLGNIRVLTICLVRNLWRLMAVWGVIMLLLFFQVGGRLKRWFSAMAVPIAWLMASGISVYSMCAVEYAPERVWSIMVIFCLITVGATAARVDWTDFRGAVPAFLLALVILGHFPAVMQAANRGWQLQLEREAYIVQQKEAGNLDLILPSLYVDSPYSVLNNPSELSADCAEWPNQEMANFYGIHSIAAGADYGVPLETPLP